MLPEVPVKFLSVFLACVLILTQTVSLAGPFEDALRAGENLAGRIRGSGPSQNETSLVPRFEEAQGARGQYEGYYTNPGGLGDAGLQSEELQFLRQASEVRPKYDLSEDPVFGNRCLSYETVIEDGVEVKRCTMWSLSWDLLTQTYPDCQRVLIPRYESSELRTCRSSVKVVTKPECTISRSVSVQVRDGHPLCSNELLTVEENQIYAVCRENVELYRVYRGNLDIFAGHYQYVDDVLCGPGWSRCSYCYNNSCPPAYTVSSESEIPPYSSYLGDGVANVWVTGGSGSRVGHGTWYSYYLVRHPSTVEKVFLSLDSTCARNDLLNWMENCTVREYVKCGPGGVNCVTLMQDGEETGASTGFQCASAESVIEGMYTQVCTTSCDGGNLDGCSDDCKEFINCQGCTGCGTCPLEECSSCQACDDRQSGTGCSGCTGCSGLSYCAEVRDGCLSDCADAEASCVSSCDAQRETCIAGCGGNSQCMANCNSQHSSCISGCLSTRQSCDAGCNSDYSSCVSACSVAECPSCSSCVVYQNPGCTGDCQGAYCQQVCSVQFVPGYEVCSLPDSSEGVRLNGRIVGSSPVTETQTVVDNGIPVFIKRVAGGPGVLGALNDWYARMTFACEETESECAALEAQGCRHQSSECANEECTEYIHTYRCGYDRITGYTVAYSCLGNVRCVGSDCFEISYEANTDFPLAVSAAEILNMARVDSLKGETLQIFPGHAMECMSSPKNCCKPVVGGVSPGDYVMAGRSLYEMYRFASQGFQAVGESYAQTVTLWANEMAGKLGLGTVSSWYTVDVTAAMTNTAVTTPLGTTTITTYFDYYSGVPLQSTAVMPSGVASMIGSIMTAVNLIMTVYTLLKIGYDLTFQCRKSDYETAIRIGQRLCHHVDTVSSRKFGLIKVRTKRYCCFNSLLARIVHEQGRPQIGLSWGGGREGIPLNCRGFTPEELASLDFSRMDLGEYIQYVQHKVELTEDDVREIERRVKERYRSGVSP